MMLVFQLFKEIILGWPQKLQNEASVVLCSDHSYKRSMSCS